jgi:hypothetical protein
MICDYIAQHKFAEHHDGVNYEMLHTRLNEDRRDRSPTGVKR